MRRLNRILILAVLLSAFLLLSGFSKMQDRSIIFISDKKQYSINDVTLKFKFGIHDPYGQRYANYRERIVLLFANRTNYTDLYENPVDFENPNLFFIRDIDPDKFYSEEYYYEDVGFSCGKKDIYNHSEKITIPQEAFDKQSGSIYFIVKIELWDNSGEIPAFHGDGDSFSERISYKIKGSKVEISM